MGDIADMMLEGSMCQYCGEILDGQGFPQVCAACQDEMNVDKYGDSREKKPAIVRRKVKCQECGKKVWESGLLQHMKDKHETENA